jgi:catechol 2,3-dioxygenase-like lactoylglutathione lyase family enzyme
MITNISITSVFVKDIDAAKAFYVDVLGLVEHTDITLPDGSYRWCTVMHPSQPELAIHLTVPGPPLSPDLQAAVNRALDQGDMFGLGMTVDDCQKTYEELTAKGVEFVQTPQVRPYGVEAVARDNSGNWMVLVEHKEFSPADFD